MWHSRIAGDPASESAASHHAGENAVSAAASG